jgi:ABC-type branched-subunit amino acid transport system ATPase component
MVEYHHTETGSKFVTQPRVLLRAINLFKSFGGQKVLNGVSVEVREGEIILLKGDNGSGKTTLLNILSGCLEPDAGTIEYALCSQLEVFKFPRRWWQEVNPFDHFLPERVVWDGMCRTWQDARLFSSQDLSANIAVAYAGQLGEDPINALFRVSSVRKEEYQNLSSSNALLSSLGLDSAKSTSGDRVSFDHAKRVALARSARTGARVLFLDEPLAGLDNSGGQSVLRVLSEFSREKGITLIIVEHVFNIPLIMQLATTVWTLARGEIVSGEATQGSDAKAKDPTLDELIQGVSSEPWQVQDIPLYGGGMLRKATLTGTTPGTPILEIDDLVVFRGNRLIVGNQTDDQRIEGLSFTVRAGELAVLSAPNGWGKSTLLEAIAGVLKPSRGTIKFRGKRINTLPVWERAKQGLSLVQSRNHFFASLSVEETLRLSGLEITENVSSLRRKKMGNLSGGEKRQIALAKIKITGGSLYMLDEPFEGLDHSAYRRHLSLLKPCREGGMLVAIPAASAFLQASRSNDAES